MNENMNTALARAGIILALLLLVLSAGCIRHLPLGSGADTVTPEATPLPSPAPSASSPGTGISNQTAVPNVSVAVSPAPVTIRLAEVDPGPYVTPDPYGIPYRDHGNWSTGEPDRIPRIPEFTKQIILRSNTTAFHLNVTRGPLVIDLTYHPRFSNPDQTTLDSLVAGDSETSGSTETSSDGRNYGVAMNSFVFSNAEISVIDEISGATVEKEGFGGIYSTDLEKRMTVYREGPFIITLKGDNIDVTMAIITGSAREVETPAPTPEMNDWAEGCSPCPAP
jgi:hypothetical protein